jgi:hypothetical protein
MAKNKGTILNRLPSPLIDRIKRSSVLCIHCDISHARPVDLSIDSKWIKTNGHGDSVLIRQIIVGTREVIIYAKYDQSAIYHTMNLLNVVFDDYLYLKKNLSIRNSSEILIVVSIYEVISC